MIKIVVGERHGRRLDLGGESLEILNDMVNAIDLMTMTVREKFDNEELAIFIASAMSAMADNLPEEYRPENEEAAVCS